MSREVEQKLELYKKIQEYKKEIENEIETEIKKGKYDFKYFLTLRQYADETNADDIKNIEQIEQIKKKINDHMKSKKGEHDLFKIIELRF